VPANQPMSETVVSIFKDREANLPEARLDVSHLTRPSASPARSDPNIQAVDLTGKAKDHGDRPRRDRQNHAAALGL
jgi:hypothetical protein